MDNSKVKISATIVLYKEDIETLQKAIDSFLRIPISKKLYLIDNSPTDRLKILANNEDVDYFFMNKNIGFGAGHNKVLNKIKYNSNYHLILNPDISFNKGVIESLITRLGKSDDIVMIAPKVVFPSGKHQYTARKYPTFFDLIIRRLHCFKDRLFQQEYRDYDLSKPFFVEYLTGCFQLYKTADFVALNGFDSRYFLYMEDVDICKKIDETGKKKLYYPEVTITHILKKGSSKSLKLLYFHIVSAIKYFLKWGF